MYFIGFIYFFFNPTSGCDTKFIDNIKGIRKTYTNFFVSILLVNNFYKSLSMNLGGNC